MKGKNKFSTDMPVAKAAVRKHGNAVKHKTYLRFFRPERAAEAIGPLEPGITVHGLTDGHYACIDVMQHIISETEPRQLSLSTWTATGIDVRRLYALKKRHTLDIVMLVDRSYITREPAYCAVMRKLFGDDSIRTWNCHAKFSIYRGGKFDVLLTTSMNLAQNKRIENYQIETDQKLVEQYQYMVDQIFNMQPAGRGFEISAEGRRNTERLVREIMGEETGTGANAFEVPEIPMDDMPEINL